MPGSRFTFPRFVKWKAFFPQWMVKQRKKNCEENRFDKLAKHSEWIFFWGQRLPVCLKSYEPGVFRWIELHSMKGKFSSPKGFEISWMEGGFCRGILFSGKELPWICIERKSYNYKAIQWHSWLLIKLWIRMTEIKQVVQICHLSLFSQIKPNCMIPCTGVKLVPITNWN